MENDMDIESGNISLSAFAQQQDINKGTLQRMAKGLGIDTSNGLSSEAVEKLLAEISRRSSQDNNGNGNGNGNSSPVLPTYSITKMQRHDLTIQDRMDQASQFLELVDQLTTAMDDDINNRMQQLKRTRQWTERTRQAQQDLKTKFAIYQAEQRLLDSQQEMADDEVATALTELEQFRDS